MSKNEVFLDALQRLMVKYFLVLFTGKFRVNITYKDLGRNQSANSEEDLKYFMYLIHSLPFPLFFNGI